MFVNALQLGCYDDTSALAAREGGAFADAEPFPFSVSFSNQALIGFWEKTALDYFIGEWDFAPGQNRSLLSSVFVTLADLVRRLAFVRAPPLLDYGQ